MPKFATPTSMAAWYAGTATMHYGSSTRPLRRRENSRSHGGRRTGWRRGARFRPDGVENILIRLADGAVLARLGGTYWANGEMRANRDDVTAAWSPDSRAVIEVSNDRWDTYSLAYYAVDRADKAAALDLRALVEPALKAKAAAGQAGEATRSACARICPSSSTWWSGSIHRDALRAQGGNEPRLQRAGRHRAPGTASRRRGSYRCGD